MPAPAAQAASVALIRRCIDLRRLYLHAANACEPGLRMVLKDNVQTMDLLIGDLQAQCFVGADRSRDHGSWGGAARAQLARWLMSAAPRHNVAWLQTLTNHESALLGLFEQTIARLPADSARAMCRQLPRLHGIHQDMHNLVGPAH
ncbi:MAG: hypothetical protein ABI268_09290 [Rhodanobacter sp.]